MSSWLCPRIQLAVADLSNISAPNRVYSSAQEDGMVRKFAGSLAAAAFLLALPVAAQKLSSYASFGACGNPNAQFDVKTESTLRGYTPDPGKALVYFIEKDAGAFFAGHTRIGIDGHWVGATEGNSYFALSLDPGVHHICANTHMGKLWTANEETALAHFTAEPGAIYYFETKNLALENQMIDVSLVPLDSDEGASLAGSYPVSIFHRRK